MEAPTCHLVEPLKVGHRPFIRYTVAAYFQQRIFLVFIQSNLASIQCFVLIWSFMNFQLINIRIVAITAPI